MRAFLALLTLALALALACGSSKPAPQAAGSLTDPRTVPTATPWNEPPPPTFLTGTPVAPQAQPGTTYTVQPNDIPATIAAKLGVDVDELMRINDITDPSKLQVGQVLKVPARASGR